MHSQDILATKNCTSAHSGISNTYTYTNFVRNLGYPHNKVLHFMLIQVFLLPKAACKFKYIFLQTKIAFKLKRYFCKVFLYITYNIYTFLWDILTTPKITCTQIQVSCYHIQRCKLLKVFCYLFYTYMSMMNKISKHLSVRKLLWHSP